MQPDISAIRLSDFHYDLPEDRIAQQPLSQRDQSRLLHYRAGEIVHKRFENLPELLPPNVRLIFNDTRVIQARLYFRRKSGALIEILLLTPHQPAEVQQAMQVEGSCIWHCIIGRKKRWKAAERLERSFRVGDRELILSAELVGRDANLVRFSWDQPLAWVDVVAALGELPLPPYIHRKANLEDAEQYQTVYAEHEGAVAAPTAGLHFTPEVLSTLADKGIPLDYVTLHVSAGTFLPVKHDEVIRHDMHAEQFLVQRQLLESLRADERERVVVGTTSMRVLESLYWLGHQILENGLPLNAGPLKLSKLYPYAYLDTPLPTVKDSLTALLDYMDHFQMRQLLGETEIFIMPAYRFQMCRGLITNFHMPETTLILLVAAFVGEDWKRIYESALQNDYRFLSYGDSSFLWS